MSIQSYLTRCDEMARKAKEQERESINSHVVTCDIKKNITCESHVISHVEYKELAKQLEKWDVKYRGYILKKYPLTVIKEAISRTKFKEKNLDKPGAYFNKVIRSLHKL